MAWSPELRKLLSRTLTGAHAGQHTRTVQRMAVISTAAGICLYLLGHAVVNGFQWEIPQRMGRFWGHLQVRNLQTTEQEYREPLKLDLDLRQTLEQEPEVVRVSPVILVPALAQTKAGMEGLLLKGMDTVPQPFPAGTLVQGPIPRWPKANAQEILLPKDVARNLNLKLGDKLTVYFMQEPVRMRSLKVVGLFEMPMQSELGRPVALVPSALLSRILGWGPDRCSHLELELKNFESMASVRNRIETMLPVQQECLTLQDQMPSLFEWLNFFDTNRLVLLLLLASVGAVNLISALFILLLERQNSLGILQSLGLRSGPLALVVWQLGMRMVLKGWLLGNLCLGILMFTQIRYRWFGLDPGSYFLDAVPLRLSWSEWALVNGWALAATSILLYLAAFFFAQRTVDRNIKFS